MASWNIRELDSGKYGPRCSECFFYASRKVTFGGRRRSGRPVLHLDAPEAR